ncbi:MAG: flagellar hook capping FlgD N-terminal domain-containing protein [Candidatus Sericytochromatia bacterium]|nr:flagellar hook capping FlgD N-terminal domain-containing protein [Candidatus Sericytochromatia bacterium]
MPTAIDKVAPGTGAPTTLPNPKQLGQEEFLKLLVTQLKSQDPMKPVEDTAFIAQMAQFSSLNQMQSLNKSFETFNRNLSDAQQLQTMASSAALIGKVVYAGPDRVSRSMGTIQEIRRVDGDLKVVLRGVDREGNTFTDRAFPLGEVQQIGMAPEEVERFQQEVEARMAAAAAVRGGAQ